MIKITKEQLYKLDRLRQGVPNQEYLVDGKDVYIGNPYKNITFLRKAGSGENLIKEDINKLISQGVNNILLPTAEIYIYQQRIAPPVDVTIKSGYAAYIPDTFEVLDGVTFEVEDGAIFEIG